MPNPSRHAGPILIALFAFLAATGVALAIAVGRMHPLAGWIATAAAMASAWEAARRGRPLLAGFSERFPRLSKAAVAAVPWVILAVVAGWALWPMPAGEMPVSQDHGHHYLATHVLVNDFIREFRLFGWTDRVTGGLPFGDVYPSLAYLVTGGLNLLTFGVVGLEASYAWGIVTVWACGIVAVGLWSRTLADEAKLAFVGVAPFVAGLGYLFDVGGDREGGWVYHMFHGVWPQQIATAALYLGLLALFWLADRPSTRRLGVAAVAMGIAVWFHPIAAVNLALLTPLATLAIALDPRDEVRGSVVWVCVSLLAGAVIAMLWFSHLVSASDVLRSNIAYWHLLAEMGERLWRGELFANGHALVGLLALVGAAAAIVRGGRRGLFAVLAFVVLLVFGGMNLLLALDVGYAEQNKLFMYRRIAVTVKPLYFAFAGLGGSVVAGSLASAMGSVERRPRWISVAMIIVSAPLVWTLAAGLGSLVRGPVGRILTAEVAGIEDDVRELEQLLRDREPSDGLRRAGFWTRRGQHGEYALLAIADANYGHLPTRRPPAQAFTESNDGPNVREMAFGSADVIVARTKLNRSGLELVRQIGEWHVYDIKEPKPSIYPVKMVGGGQVEVADWGDHRQELTLSGVTPKSRLIIGRPVYDKWKVEQAGEGLAVTEYRAASGYTYMEVANVDDGRVTVYYDHHGWEKLAFWIGLLVLATCIAFLFWNREVPRWPASRSSQRWIAIAAISVAATVVLLAVVVLARWGDDGVEQEWAKKSGDVIAVLHHVDPKFDYEPRPDCIRPYTRNPHVNCVESQHEPRLGVGERRKKTLVPSCVRFGVPEKGSAELEWSVPARTTHVVGRLHGGRVANRLDIEVRSGDKSAEVTTDGKRFQLRASQRVKFELDNSVGRTADVCLELVAIRR